MSYIGSTPTTQSFIAGTDYFNGNGSTVNFTLSRSVNSVNDIEVIVNNVEQIPSGYSVSGTTLTFSAAPSAGTSNVYVRYLSTTNLSLAIPAGTSATFNTVTVADGSATTPSITNDGDTNTGIFFPAADTIAFAEGGAEIARFDSAGNMGLGATPSAWGSNNRTIDMYGIGSFSSFSNGSGGYELDVGLNAYNSASGWRYKVSSYAVALYQQAAGSHIWYNAAAGTAGNAISFTQAMTLDSSGNVGIGVTPAFKLDISGSGTTAKVNTLDTHDGGASLSTWMKVGRRAGTGTNAYINTLHSGSDAVSALTFAFGTTGTGTEAMRIDSSGNVGIGTSSPAEKLSVAGAIRVHTASSAGFTVDAKGGLLDFVPGANNVRVGYVPGTSGVNTGILSFVVGSGSEAARIDSSGNVLVGTTTNSPAGNNVVGAELQALGSLQLSRDGGAGLQVNRKTDDGEIVAFRQGGTQEGSISVSGTTVSYNGGHLSRWAQTTAPKDDTLVKGTVLSNLDEMNVYTDADGNPIDNEQLNKVKVSDVEGDANVAGVFVNWTHDDAHDVDEINMAMTGDMIIRVAQGTTVARGDLLMSAGDGTAKPQGDDIVRSKTVAKVTSTHVTCTYADGSFCVPCVLMAC